MLVCQFETEFDTSHNTQRSLKEPDYIMEMLLQWEQSGGRLSLSQSTS